MLDGVNVSYTGGVTVGHAAPSTPAAAGLKEAAGKLFDSLGRTVPVLAAQ
jgi:hypothetical protein